MHMQASYAHLTPSEFTKLAALGGWQCHWVGALLCTPLLCCLMNMHCMRDLRIAVLGGCTALLWA